MTIQPKILVIDDELHIRRLLHATLARAAYEVIEAETAAQALVLLKEREPEIVLLDLGLPDRDGLELIPLIRQRSKATLLVVSAREETDQKVAALDLGAADYVTKPFDTDELLARIRAALRHRATADGGETAIDVADLHIDLLNRRIAKGGEEVKLTPKEYGVLAELARFPGRVITHDQILRTVWPQEDDRHIEYLRVVVRNLRQKIEDDAARPVIILNELRVGYRLVGAKG